MYDLILTAMRFLSNQENVGKREVDGANCQTVFLSEYVVIFQLQLILQSTHKDYFGWNEKLSPLWSGYIESLISI